VTGRRVAGTLFVAFAAGVAIVLGVGSILVHPAQRTIGPSPVDLHAEDITIASASGSTLHGWLGQSRPHRGVVVLMHGVRASRLMMVDRARFLQRAGYDVLLFDFQAHGESPGQTITFGWRESDDARAAVAFARARFTGEQVAAIGVSLGGAAVLLGREPLPVDALVVESVYPTVEDAVSNRVHHYLGPLGAIAAPLLLCQLEPRLGVTPAQLRPIEGIARVRCPLFLMSGAEDHYTTVSETRLLFAGAREPKQLWIVPRAAHVDLHALATPEYERRVLGFLESALKR
jgi:fermentation-respiration switch protein FrsA (DUF1100 family)